ncbi:DEAD-domain-containing protein [Hypoxylon sp. FL0543]|nr:DEAD-domain-containing protein [Hypoxylon sp. FL0543]
MNLARSLTYRQTSALTHLVFRAVSTVSMQESQPTSSRPRPKGQWRDKKRQKGDSGEDYEEHGKSRHTTPSSRLSAPKTHNKREGRRSYGDYRPAASAAPKVPETALSTDAPSDTPKFTDLANGNLIHPILLRTISEDLKFDHMTPVQAATIYPLLKDRCDMLAQAKTGTGKTIAFLLPAIQKMIHRNSSLRGKTSLLVIAPTRELAMQIGQEAQALLQRIKQFKVCICIGGTNKNSEEKLILKGCDILIATPGRLHDHLTDERSPVTGVLQHLETLVLDEADRLLDMGFLDTLRKIIGRLPDKKVAGWQGLLFSATVPEHVQRVAELALSNEYKSISTLVEGELPTHERVHQQLITVPTFSDMAAGLLGAIRRELAAVGPESFKAIVFVPTAFLGDFYAEILQRSGGLPPVTAIHSRMTQSKRTRIVEEFRAAKSSIFVATDVIARGMDFPLVTNVFQAGIPPDRESYIHRLGRTARAGAEGRGTFIITSDETFFPKWTLKDITFEQIPPDLSARQEVRQIAEKLDPTIQARAYSGLLGFYKSKIKPMGWDNDRLVKEANEFALDGLGAASVPPLLKSTIGKMGLRGVRGLKVRPNDPAIKR